MEKVKIYKLIDPVTNNIMYIGKTKNTLRKRYTEHLCRAKQGHKLKVSPRKEIPEEDIQKASDEFAIEFSEWYLNLWHTDDDSSFDNNSPKELLEIFKKEKGL